MTSIDITGPAAVQLAAQLIDNLRTQGARMSEAIASMRTNVERLERSLQDGDNPFGIVIITDDPASLMRAMEPTVNLLRKLGVNEDAILATRRGEWVNPRDWGFDVQDMDIAFNLTTTVREPE